MTKFYTGIRSVEVYLTEIERYYNLLKSSKDIDQYGHYLILMKNQIEFLSIYIIEEDKFEEFETNIHLTAIDKDMVATILTTVRTNIKFIVKGLKLTRLEEDKEKLKKWDNRFGNDSGYQGEIRLGKPGRKEFDKNGNPIHFVDSETFSSIKKQIGISEKAVKDNSLIEGINGEKKAPYFNGYKPNFYFKQQGETK